MPDNSAEDAISRSSGLAELNEEYFVNYCILLPIISIVGIAGNVVNLAVLSRPGFKGFMFTYMKLLSLTDISYLLLTIAACVFTDLGYYLTDDARVSTSHALVTWVWVYLTPIWNVCGSASDLIVVCMTVARHRILRDIDRVNLKEWTRKRGYHVRGIVAVACGASVFLHLPYFFQFNVKEENCGVLMNASMWYANPSSPEDPTDPNGTCYVHVTSCITESPVWMACGYIYQIVLKIGTLVAIFTLNILMVLRLRQIWEKRRCLRCEKRKRARKCIYI